MRKIILDTNVPVKASVSPESCSVNKLVMKKKCMEYINDLVNSKDTKIVLDMDFEILNEYRNNVSDKSNMGKIFFGWLYNYYSDIQPEDNIKLMKNEYGQYLSFPYDKDTESFDESDKKFIALANSHKDKPPFVEASDGKWLGYEDSFAKYGITIEFIDRDYAQKMYEQKILNKGLK